MKKFNMFSLDHGFTFHFRYIYYLLFYEVFAFFLDLKMKIRLTSKWMSAEYYNKV